MLNLYQSNRLEALVTLLAAQIKQPASADVFSPDTILVHSPGMSQWLKIQIAEQNGIAANIDFPLPSSFIWRLYQHLLPDVPEQSPFNKDRMTWKLYQLLPRYLEQDEFKSIYDYLASEKPVSYQSVSGQDELNRSSAALNYADNLTSHEQRRLFQLAEKVADVFDNYLMYRPHWLEHWQQGNRDLPATDQQLGDEIKGQHWQAILWQALVEFTAEQQQSPLHRASMHQLLLRRLSSMTTEEFKTALPKPMARLFIFGISTLPTHQLEILNALSEHIDVQILWLNPCCQYWGDILSDKTIARLNSKQQQLAQLNVNHKHQYFVTGNPLLASWGKVGRDYLDVLTNSDIQIHDIFIQDTDSSHLSHLEKIQNDILNLQYRGEQTPLTPEQINSDFGKVTLQAEDDSILVHNCHSRTRELEVLKDKLLQWLEQDDTLEPKDILVMVPDVNQYAPFIESVFKSNYQPSKSHDENAEQSIGFTISDRGGLEENPLLNTFIDLLVLPSSRFSVSELLDHLEVPALMNTFKLTQTDISLIKQWIEQSQIKWAKDAKHKAKWQLPEIDLNTWVYGLKRMVLGVSLGSQDIWNNILAYQNIEGLNQGILGKLLNYFSFVSELEQVLTGDKSIEQWSEVLEQLVSQLFTTKEHKQHSVYQNAHQQKLDELTLQKIRNGINQLNVYVKDNDFNGEINFELIHHFFSQYLSESGVAQRFLAGRVNFCTLMPMRSVPFKVICILGLNDGDYPRHVDPISFDLVGLNQPRKGDRSRKLDERYLFLEAVTSARQKLHLSFIGQSSKNNQSLMPSVILSELIDYLNQSFIVDNPVEGGSVNQLAESKLMIKHKLQPFNQVYFTEKNINSLYKSYSKRWFKVCETQINHQSNSAVSDHFAQAIDSGGPLSLEQDPSIDPLVDQNYIESDPIQPQVDQHKAQKDQTNAGNDIDAQQLKNTLSNSPERLEIDLSELIEFWTHPIKYYYRRVLDIHLDFNNEALSDHEVFQHDGLQKFVNQSTLLNRLLINKQEQGSDAINSLFLRSGDYPAKQWGSSLLTRYQKQSQHLVDLMGQILGLDQDEHFTLNKTQHQVAFEFNSSSAVAGEVLLQATVETFGYAKDQQINVLVRTGKIRHVDKLSMWLTHLTKCAAYQGAMSILIGNDNTVGWFEQIQPEQAKQCLSMWVEKFTAYKLNQQMLKWHIDPALDWFTKQQAGGSELSLQNAIITHITNNSYGLNLADDEYAKKHLQNIDDFTPLFFQLTEQYMHDLALNYQEGKSGKVIDNIKQALNQAQSNETQPNKGNQ